MATNNIITLNIDSSTSWDLAVPSDAGILQQTSGTISELPAVASGFSVEGKEVGTFTAIPSIELANFREGSGQERPGTESVYLPIDGSKLREWLTTDTPENIYSPHLYHKETDRQGWTYITDFTLHPYTPYVADKNLPFEYYLHGRIRHDGKLEFAFFSETYINVPSEVSIDLANITLEGGSEQTFVHTLQYACGNQSVNPLRIAGREEAEKYLLSEGKLIRSRCPIFLGTLMHSGKAIYETKTVTESTGDSISFWPVINFLGHMWSYWGVIADNVLYIVGLPVYNGSEKGHIHTYLISSGNQQGVTYYFQAEVPPTMPCDFPYSWGLGEADITHFVPIEKEFEKFNSKPPAETKAVREAYKKACNTQPYIGKYITGKGWSFANHSMAITAADLIENNIATIDASVQYELSTGATANLISKDSLSEGINMTGFLVGAEGGVYSTKENARLVQCIDGYDNDYGDSSVPYLEYQDYGWKTGVRYNDAGLKKDPNTPVLNSLDITNNVTTGFVSIPAVFPNTSNTILGGFTNRPTGEDAPSGWIVHAFNVLQRGNTYTIWTSSWDGSLKILKTSTAAGDTPEDPPIDPPITQPPYPTPGPGPGDPDPDPDPDPEPDPGPDYDPIPAPGPTPVPPEPPNPIPPPPMPPTPTPTPPDDDDEWTDSTLPTVRKYVSGSNVRVVQTSQTQDFTSGRKWTYQLYIEDYKTTISDNIDLSIVATANPRDAGTYISTPNSTTYTWKWGIASFTSTQVSVNGDKIESGGSPPDASLTGTVQQAISIAADLAFDMATISSNEEITEGNTVKVSKQGNETYITLTDYSTKTRYKQAIQAYSISRNDANLKAIIMGAISSNIASSVSASLDKYAISGSITGSSGLAAPGVSLGTPVCSYSYTGETATASGPCNVNSIYAAITPTGESTISITCNRPINYGPSGNETAVASINDTVTVTVTDGTVSV